MPVQHAHINTRPYALGRDTPYIPRGRHLAIMSILWERGSATAAQILDELAELEEPEIARQTVLTYVGALRRYGWIGALTVGGRLTYYPTLAIDLVRDTTISRVTDRLYAGSREALLIDVVNSRLTHPNVLRRVRAALERRLTAADETPAGAGRGAGRARPSATPAG